MDVGGGFLSDGFLGLGAALSEQRTLMSTLGQFVSGSRYLVSFSILLNAQFFKVQI